MAVPDDAVDAVRGFNRAYTRRFGLLDQQHLGSDFSLGEVRVLYELAHRDGLSAAGLARSLELDPGHLSRMLAGLRRGGLVRRERSSQDRRASVLGLTPAGRRAFDRLDRKATVQVSALLRAFPDGQRAELVEGLTGIRRLLEPREAGAPAVLIRTHRPGDLGWVLERHGVVYTEEYGWGAPFEAIVARVVAEFAETQDPVREACWVAELEGRRAPAVRSARGSLGSGCSSSSPRRVASASDVPWSTPAPASLAQPDIGGSPCGRSRSSPRHVRSTRGRAT